MNMKRYIPLALFVGCVPLANWLIHNWGTVCDRICLIPVWPGIMAPSGVVVAGVALCLRDLVHRELGAWWAVGAIVIGALLSWGVASPHVALASGVAFLVSELADQAVYAPLYRKRLYLAMLASGAVGLVVDSVLFLWIAFSSLDYIDGQIIAKGYAVVAATAVIWCARKFAR